MSNPAPFSLLRRRAVLAIAAAGCLLAFAPSLAHAADYCVHDDACAQQAGSITVDTLDDALGFTEIGPSADRIFLGPGTYTAPTTAGFSATQYPVEIIGAGTDKTELTGPTNTSPVLTVTNFSSVVSNLRIVVPAENDGFPKTGLSLGGTAKGLLITDATSPATGTYGAVIGPGLLEDSTITLPAHGPKAGIQADTDARISNVNVTASQAIDVDGADVQIDRARITTEGIGVWSTRIHTQLTNSLVQVSGASGVGIAATDGISNADASLTARNVTVVGDGGSAIGVESSSSVAHAATAIVDSSVVRGFKYPLWRGASAGTANLAVSYSDYDAAGVLSGGSGTFAPGAGNIGSDPLFVAPLDLHPLAGSPLIDAGNPNNFADALDLDGNPRVVGGRRDIGAFERQPGTTQPPSDQPPASDPASGAPSGSAPAGQPPAGAIKDTLAPTIAGLKIAPARFSARRGGRISFKLSERATVTIAVKRRAAHGSRYVKFATLRRTLPAGSARIAIKRRLAGVRLRPGRYAAVVTATDAGGNRSRAYLLSFTVVR